METYTGGPYNRSNLFLVRVWLRNNGSADLDSSKAKWCGSIRRIVDGEAHQFSDWQGLVDLLEAMVSNTDVQQ